MNNNNNNNNQIPSFPPPLPPPPPPQFVWKPEDLKMAAINGDVDMLKKSLLAKVPLEYYLTVFQSRDPEQISDCGNIFHLAVSENKPEFIKEAINILPPLTIQHLLGQRRTNNDSIAATPLQLAVEIGNLEIVTLFLDTFKSPFPSPTLPRPWRILTVISKETVCHWAITNGKEECALEVITIDMEFFCNKIDKNGNSLLYQAIWHRFTKLAIMILSSATTFSIAAFAGFNNFTPLHVVSPCSDGELICKLLLEKNPSLVEQKAMGGTSVFHSWANEGNLWPFKLVLKNEEIKPEVKKAFVRLISATDEQGYNPFHYLAAFSQNQEVAVQIAQLLVDTYKLEVATPSVSGQLVFPWLAKTNNGHTPLSLAIDRGYQDLAIYILSVDNNALISSPTNSFFVAADKGYTRIAEKFLEIVDKEKWTHLLTSADKLNILHFAPKCSEVFLERLLMVDPKLLEESDINGTTIMHSWVGIGKVEPFKYFLENDQVDHKLREQFINLVTKYDYTNGNSPFHVAAISYHNEATDEIVKLLADAYTKEATASNLRPSHPSKLPWIKVNKEKRSPLQIAIDNQHETLAICLLSLYGGYGEYYPCRILNYYIHDEKYHAIFCAIQMKCYLVAKQMLAILAHNEEVLIGAYLTETHSRSNVLHLAPYCTEEFGKWLIDEISYVELITQKNNDGLTPLHLASDVGAEWLIKVILDKYHLDAFTMTPLPWIKACEKGHVSSVRAFIDKCPGSLKEHCHRNKDSPLHHIKLLSVTEYEDFLRIPNMKDVINQQDSEGETPLHKAIRRQDIFLTEALLKMEDISCDIKDHLHVSAKGLLAALCLDNNDWEEMCKKVGIDPKIITTYFKSKTTNMLEVRNTLSVVAALLATITFTAGFTLPGGFNQETGEAILANKIVFLVFLISDTLAMCCSMLVLICLIWSMVYDSNKALFFIDRSMKLLMYALYFTLLAFMTGVFVVISPKALWAAIVVLVMCSLIGISVKGDTLYTVLHHLVPSTNTEQGDRYCLLQLGRGGLRRGGYTNATDSTITDGSCELQRLTV